MAWDDDFSLDRFSPLAQVTDKSERLLRMGKSVSGINNSYGCFRLTGQLIGKVKDERGLQTQRTRQTVGRPKSIGLKEIRQLKI